VDPISWDRQKDRRKENEKGIERKKRDSRSLDKWADNLKENK